MSNTADNAVQLWELLRTSQATPSWETAREHLGLTDDEMREAVDLLNEALEFNDHEDKVTV